MTPEDGHLLQILGISLSLSIGSLTLVSFIFGFSTLLLLMLINRNPAHYSGFTSLAVPLVGFTIAMIYWVVYVVYIITIVQSALVRDITLPLGAKRDLVNYKIYKLDLAMSWITALGPVVNDAVIIWRGWKLFPEHRWATASTIALWIATVTITLSQLGLMSSFSGSRGFTTGSDRITSNLYVASVGLSLITNAVATFSIAYGMWSYRRFLLVHLGNDGRKGRVQKILSLLVESGVIYCLLQLMTAILNAFPIRSPYSKVNIAAQLTSAGYTEISAVYPTLVMFFARGQGTFIEAYGVRTEQNSKYPPASNFEIVFASQPVGASTNSITNNESISFPGRTYKQDSRLVATV